VKEKGWTKVRTEKWKKKDEQEMEKMKITYQRWDEWAAARRVKRSGGQESEEKIRFMILLSLYKGDIIIIKIILFIWSVRVRWPTGQIKPPATDPTEPPKPREAVSWTRDNRTDPTWPDRITRVGRFQVGRTGLSTPTYYHDKLRHV
jgi:hypothetical protein